MSTPDKPDQEGWFDKKKNIDLLFWGLIAVCILLSIAEFTYVKHPYFGIDGWPEFYEIFGFFAFIGIVFAGLGLRKLIMRREDYYDRPGE